MKRKLALSMILRAAALLLESEYEEESMTSEGSSADSGPSDSGPPKSRASTGGGPTNDPAADGPHGKRRKGQRIVYRPQGSVDEVSARRAEEVLKQRGLVPTTPPKRT